MNVVRKATGVLMLLLVCSFSFTSAQQTQEEPDIRTYIAADDPPKPLNMREVQKVIGYPKIAREAGIEGSVVARILVDTDGSYIRHEIVHASHPVLEGVVEQHLSLLQFNPAVKDGKAVKFWVNLPFNFKLLGGSSKPGMDENIKVDVLPKPLNFREVAVDMRYPESAKALQLEGKVVARVLIDEQGQYLTHKIAETSHPAFIEAVNEQVGKLTFKPAMKDEKAVKFWVNLPFQFKLDPKEKSHQPKEVFMKLYPNPGSDQLTLHLASKRELGEMNVEVLTADGKRVWAQRLSEKNQIMAHDIQAADWPAGTYHVRVETAQGVFSETWVRQ